MSLPDGPDASPDCGGTPSERLSGTGLVPEPKGQVQEGHEEGQLGPTTFSIAGHMKPLSINNFYSLFLCFILHETIRNKKRHVAY